MILEHFDYKMVPFLSTNSRKKTEGREFWWLDSFQRIREILN